MKLEQILGDVGTLLRMPTVSIDLMCQATETNDPFYQGLVREHYRATQRRHRKLPLVKAGEWGIALLTLPPTFAEYFMRIDGSARRNFKKAQRSGYRFERIDYNACLDDIGAIRRSATVRQGEMPPEYLNGTPAPCLNPPSRTDVHDYPYFGVARDGHLWSYAGCLISGELCMIEHIIGHADRQPDGVVPMLIIGVAERVLQQHPKVKYYGYGSYFGASESMRRFKRKFGFEPHRVKWILSGQSG